MVACDALDQPSRWYGTNLVGLPTQLLASTAFNSHPLPLTIAGTCETHPGLFTLLEGPPRGGFGAIALC